VKFGGEFGIACRKLGQAVDSSGQVIRDAFPVASTNARRSAWAKDGSSSARCIAVQCELSG
jgi:hypothetical protein